MPTSKLFFYTDFQTVCQSTSKAKENMKASEAILDKLKYTLTTAEKTQNSYKTKANEQDTNEKKLLNSIKYL